MTEAAPPYVPVTVGSYDEFFRREYPALVALATALTGSLPAGEDLAQEALLRAHRDWRNVAGYDRPGAWARRVVLNLAANAGARRRSERRANARFAGRPVTAAPPPEVAEFWTAVRALPRQQAAAVALHYLEDRPVSEVAQVLGCAEGTAKVHLHRGRAALARALGEPTPTDTEEGP